MTGKWRGGKGDAKRKGANDQKYREGWDRIFNNRGKKDAGKGNETQQGN